MHPNDYQDLTATTELYSEAAAVFVDNPSLEAQQKYLRLAYCAGKLNGEAGEVAEIVFKAFRGNVGQLTDADKHNLKRELGDVLWYVARLADIIGTDLETIMVDNIEKLLERKERDVLHGYGDDR